VIGPCRVAGFAAVAFIVALGAGEAGLGGLALWTAYEWLRPGDEPLPKRLRNALVPVALGIAYLIAYRLAGGGIQGGGVYVNPLTNPLGFVRAVVTRLPLLLGDAFWLFPAEAGFMWTTFGIAFGIAGASVILFIVIRILSHMSERDRGTLRWLVPGSLLAAAGTTAGIPEAASSRWPRSVRAPSSLPSSATDGYTSRQKRFSNDGPNASSSGY